jgi:hypothetical protein
MDPFSTVASRISIASIGIQIAESIHKLLRFCKSIKDALGVIQFISEDLEVLDEILSSLMTYHQGIQRRNGASPSTPIPKALSSCPNRLRDLEQVISSFERGMSQRRTWASMKAALRDDTIKKFQSNLESAKRVACFGKPLVSDPAIVKPSNPVDVRIRLILICRQRQLRSSLAQQHQLASVFESVG